MTHAWQALDRLGASVRLLPRASRLPIKSESAKAVDTLRASDAAIALPADAVLDVIRNRLISVSSERGQYLRGDLRASVWLLWTEKQPLSELPGLMDAVLTQAYKSNATARALIEAWLRAFSRNDPSVVRTGMSIRQLLIARPTPRLELWRNADRRVGLFDAREGPTKFAGQLVSGPETVEEVLSAAGFDDPLRASGGYAQAFAAAEILGARSLGVFSYLTYDDYCLNDLREPVEDLLALAEKFDMKVHVENEGVCNIAGLAEAALRLLPIDR
jgi:hypothetical protein